MRNLNQTHPIHPSPLLHPRPTTRRMLLHRNTPQLNKLTCSIWILQIGLQRRPSATLRKPRVSTRAGTSQKHADQIRRFSSPNLSATNIYFTPIYRTGDTSPVRMRRKRSHGHSTSSGGPFSFLAPSCSQPRTVSVFRRSAKRGTPSHRSEKRGTPSQQTRTAWYKLANIRVWVGGHYSRRPQRFYQTTPAMLTLNPRGRGN